MTPRSWGAKPAAPTAGFVLSGGPLSWLSLAVILRANSGKRNI
jgi:hypothetical protein